MSYIVYIYILTMTLSTYTIENIESLRKTGIYKLYHSSFPDKIYIGSAASTNFRNDNKGFLGRWKTHISHLKLNKHHSKYLQRVVNKYGIDKIKFEILEFCNPEDCIIKEQEYFNKFQPIYNSCKIAGSLLGIKRNDIAKNVHQYDKFGVYIKSYNSITDAEIETKIDKASISKAAKGDRPSAGNFLWSFDIIKTPIPLRIIEQYTLNDEFVAKYTSLEEVKIALKINSSNSIRMCMLGKQKQAYGFKWIDVVNNW
jgi:hypothetical protein